MLAKQDLVMYLATSVCQCLCVWLSPQKPESYSSEINGTP